MAGDEDAQIGSFIRTRRKELGWSLATVAEQANFSVSYISQVERGLANPTLSSLKEIAQVLGFTIGDLLEARDGDAPPNASAEIRRDDHNGDQGFVAVTRQGHRKRINYPGSGISNELLSPNLRHQMEIIWIEAASGANSGGHPHHHEGEECGVVLEGGMKFWVDDDEIILGPNDSIYFSSQLPHRWSSVGDEPLRAIWIITPPTF